MRTSEGRKGEKKMKSSLPKRPLLFPSLLLLVVIHPSCTIAGKHSSESESEPSVFTYRNGPLLTGNVNLAIMWYGEFGEGHKNITLTFIESLNNGRDVNFEPSVAQWWNKVESYQLAAKKTSSTENPPVITVKVVKQIDDHESSLGEDLSSKQYLDLVNKVSSGTPPNTVAVIVAGKHVAVEDTCSGPCYIHGVHDKQLYIVLSLTPGPHCPIGRCKSPFVYAQETELVRLVVRPPHGDEDLDAMVIHFAAALAATVTNPYSDGFSGGPAGPLIQDKKEAGIAAAKPGEAATACFGVFGSDSFPGYVGRTRIDPITSGEFNAHGLHKEKFLLPAIWDPVKTTCWTTV